MKKVLVIGIIGHTGIGLLANKAFQEAVTVDPEHQRRMRDALKNKIENPFYDSSERKRAQWKDEVHYGKRKGRQR